MSDSSETEVWIRLDKNCNGIDDNGHVVHTQVSIEDDDVSDSSDAGESRVTSSTYELCLFCG